MEKRIDSLDDSFIGAVRAFEVAARAQSLHDVAGVCHPSDLDDFWLHVDTSQLLLGEHDIITGMSGGSTSL